MILNCMTYRKKLYCYCILIKSVQGISLLFFLIFFLNIYFYKYEDRQISEFDASMLI